MKGQAFEDFTEELAEQLRSNVVDDRRNAFTDLSRLGVTTRRTIRPRGTITRSAQRLTNSQTLKFIIEVATEDPDTEVRLGAISAAGEWGGENSAKVFSETLRASNTEEELRLAAVSALGTIGGPRSVVGLLYGVENDESENVKLASLTALSELAQQELLVSKEAEGFDPLISSPVPTELAPDPSGAKAINKISDALQAVRDKGQSRYLRIKADDALHHLTALADISKT
ncbi:MAG: HEAT repeat domain-containing protein [Chloroflexi bacterium]|nr:HEAT repeat domain-containing protein [Chloroflexota bacterium]